LAISRSQRFSAGWASEPPGDRQPAAAIRRLMCQHFEAH
jgi:hypothetical protein